MGRVRLVTIAVAAIFLFVGSLIQSDLSAIAQAMCERIVVGEDDVARQLENTPPTRNWVIYNRAGAATGLFREGPGTPPAGTGSLEFNTPGPSDKVFIFNYDYVNTPLASITQLGYSTYRSAGALQQVASINIQVDENGGTLEPGDFTTLVFEPVYNTAQGPVVSNMWQTWDAIYGGNAVWWSTQPINGVCPVACYVTWNQIIAANPNATIVGGIGLNQGSGNPLLITAVDAFTIGADGVCVTYDFERFRIATNKDQCKNGGWQSVRRADGTRFRNQGDCIQYVNTGQ